METLESKRDLDERAPNSFLLEGSASLLMGHDLLIEVPVVEKFHDDAGCERPYHRELASMNECLYPTM